MNLAYVSPLPPQPSGIADYSASLLPHLRHFCKRLVAVVDGIAAVAMPSSTFDAVYDAADMEWWINEYTVPVYHMGNNISYHQYIYRLLLRFPGITVLHDGNLLPFINAMTIESGERAAFIRELSYDAGTTGTELAWQILRGQTELNPDEQPMLKRVCQASLGVIVHNDFLHSKIEYVAPKTPVAVIPMLDMTPVEITGSSLATSRLKLGFAPESILLGAFGYIAPSKRLDLVLRILARLRVVNPQLRLICVGQVVQGYDFLSQVSKLGLQDIVQVTGYVSATEFSQYLHAIDIGLNLRYPSWGEMSASLIRLLAAAKPTLVTDIASFAELPEGIACKIPLGPYESSVLESTLMRLIDDVEWRHTIGNAASAHVKQTCNPATVARQYTDFIQSIAYEYGIN